MPYPALIVPFAYLFDKKPNGPLGIEADRMQDLFWRVSLTQTYSGPSESELARDVRRAEAILAGQQPRYELPLTITPEFIRDNGSFSTSRAFAKAVLALLAARGPESFDDGAKVFIDNDWLIQANSKNYHHFFPKAYLQKRGVEKWQANHLANITIVDADLNKRVIRDRAPSKYLADFKGTNRHLRRTLDTHLIDAEKFGVWDDDFQTFFDARCAAIASELSARILPAAD